MNVRTLLVLALLTAIAAGGLWLTGDETAPPSAEAGERFLPGLLERINDIRRVQVQRSGGELVAELVRGDDGEGWRVTNRGNHPADRGTVHRTLVGLAEARRSEERTADPAAYHRLGLADIDEPAAQGMALTIEGGGEPLTVIVGRSGPADEGTYVRRSGGKRAWLIDQEIPRHLAIGDWLDGALVDLDVDELRTVDIRPQEGEAVHVRADARADDGFVVTNRPDGRALLTRTMARSLARVVTDLRADDVQPADDAAGLEPVAEARYATRDGLIIHIRTYRDAAGSELAQLDAAVTGEAGEATRAQARRLRARWAGWLYRLPEHKFVNASHDLERILQ